MFIIATDAIWLGTEAALTITASDYTLQHPPVLWPLSSAIDFVRFTRFNDVKEIETHHEFHSDHNSTLIFIKIHTPSKKILSKLEQISWEPQ